MEQMTFKRVLNGYEDICLMCGISWGDIIVRLPEYEDTNLTPADINDLRNELCLKCGKYKDAHLGACDGCRWRGEKG